jgi:hypothetical protein
MEDGRFLFLLVHLLLAVLFCLVVLEIGPCIILLDSDGSRVVVVVVAAQPTLNMEAFWTYERENDNARVTRPLKTQEMDST